MKLFLQHIKNQNLARKNCKIIFFQDLIKILQENYLAIFAIYLLQEKLHFTARLTRFSARPCKKKYLQDLGISCKTV